jgi:CO dehydrogenase maturation factor
LTRLGDSKSVPESRIDLAKEILPEYYLRKDNVTLFQVGKIARYGQGCDGPLEKVVRDFCIEGEAVHLIDIKAGVEHFGRKVPDRMEAILGVLDCTRESISIARRMDAFCRDMGMGHFWLILNKVPSRELETTLREHLGELSARVIGVVHQDPSVMEAALSGHALAECAALAEVAQIVDRMAERMSSAPEGRKRVR